MGFHLVEVFYKLRTLGVVRSKRQFSRTLGHHWSYVRDVEQRSDDQFRVPSMTVDCLVAHLRALTPFVSKEMAAEIDGVVAKVQQHTDVADCLGYRLRNSKSVSNP